MKIRFEWTDDDACWVLASPEEGDPLRIATLGWNGGEWWLWMVDPSGDIIHSDDHRRFIDVDPEEREEFERERQRIASQPDSIRPVLEAELKGRRQLQRDETRDVAMMAARIYAKTWLPAFLELQSQR